MRLHRLVVEWAGPYVVGRAVTVLHFDGTEDPAPPVAAVAAALEACKGRLNPGGTLTVPGAGDTIEDTTGDLVGVWAAATPPVVTSTAIGNAPAGVGACISWQTGGIVSGTKGPRRLRGRTFLVPLGADCYDSTGTLNTAALGNLVNLKNDLIAAGGLAIWHRPSSATASDGNSYAVLSGNVRDKVAFLSSRRD